MIPGKITSLECWLTGLYSKISLPPSSHCLAKEYGVVLWSASASLLWSWVLLQRGFLSKSLPVRGLCSEAPLSSLPNLISIIPSLLCILSLEIPGSCHIRPTVAECVCHYCITTAPGFGPLPPHRAWIIHCPFLQPCSSTSVSLQSPDSPVLGNLATPTPCLPGFLCSLPPHLLTHQPAEFKGRPWPQSATLKGLFLVIIVLDLSSESTSPTLNRLPSSHDFIMSPWVWRLFLLISLSSHPCTSCSKACWPSSLSLFVSLSPPTLLLTFI